MEIVSTLARYDTISAYKCVGIQTIKSSSWIVKLAGA